MADSQVKVVEPAKWRKARTVADKTGKVAESSVKVADKTGKVAESPVKVADSPTQVADSAGRKKNCFDEIGSLLPLYKVRIRSKVIIKKV
ncbi:hypothetical protein [Lysinibacillus sp. FSL K6-4013]|uniref:hypothetical protein n=1 Tax=Lysinibacillus sp. FSL K6-4013 TaxID=2921504 RepID=UPI00315AF47F